MKVDKRLITFGIIAGATLLGAWIFKEKIRNIFIPSAKDKNLDAFPLRQGSVGDRVYTVQKYIQKKITNNSNNEKLTPDQRAIFKKMAEINWVTGGFNSETEKAVNMFHKTIEVDETLYNEMVEYLNK